MGKPAKGTPLFDTPRVGLNPTVAEEDAPRLSAQHVALADALRDGPKTNIQLIMISHRFGARLHELKGAGFLWTRRPLGNGVHEYRMIRDFLPAGAGSDR